VKITLFVPCYIDQCMPEIGQSVVHVLEKLGHQVEFDPQLVCCGQPAFNTGCWAEARSVAERVVRRLENAETVVVPSGSCAAMIRVFYQELFHGHPVAGMAHNLSKRTYEFSELLVDVLKVTGLGAQFPAKVTFHDGCHGLRELHVKDQPRRLLAAVKGLELVELEDHEVCCGFGGMFSVKFPMISDAMGKTKCTNAQATGADYLVSNDPSCLLHLRGYLSRQKSPMRTLHLAQVLDWDHAKNGF
jgi:L-lactate dehydrogenase complex protein LldE